MRPCIEKAFFNGLCRRQKILSARSRCFAGFAFKIHAIKKSACMEALFFPPICSRSPKEASCRRHALPFTDAAPAAPRPDRSGRFPYVMTLRRFPTAPSGSLFPSALFFTACVFQSALSRPAPGTQRVSPMP